MNYLWEILLQAKSQGIAEEKIRFEAAKTYSPYMEIAEEFLNVIRLEEPYTVQINPYYRFHEVFKNLFHPELSDYPKLRSGLFTLLVHQLGENDVRKGMTREEYYKKLLSRAIIDEAYGKEAAEAFALFAGRDREVLLEGMLSLYRTGDSLTLFRHVITALITPCIVYENNDDPCSLLIYIGCKKSANLAKKVKFILDQFVGIRYRTELYYEYHFGIIGIGETMGVDEIAIC